MLDPKVDIPELLDCFGDHAEGEQRRFRATAELSTAAYMSAGLDSRAHGRHLEFAAIEMFRDVLEVRIPAHHVDEHLGDVGNRGQLVLVYGLFLLLAKVVAVRLSCGRLAWFAFGLQWELFS